MMVPTFVSEAGHKQPEECVIEPVGDLDYPKWPLVESPRAHNGKRYKVRKVVYGRATDAPMVPHNGQPMDEDRKPAVYLEEITGA